MTPSQIVLLLALDFALILPNQPPICAVDEASCRSAIAAINAGRLTWAAPGSAMRCEPAPGCFTAREKCIPGYRDWRAEGRC